MRVHYSGTNTADQPPPPSGQKARQTDKSVSIDLTPKVGCKDGANDRNLDKTLFLLQMSSEGLACPTGKM